jgi:hypothetical protein
MAENSASKLESVLKFLQVVSVVIGVAVSILSFNLTSQKEASARKAEAEAKKFDYQKYADQRKDAAERQQIEAAKPFLELRQKRYLEVVQCAAILSNPDTHTDKEISKAKARFRDLYVAELSMVEGRGVEKSMVEFAGVVDPTLVNLTPPRSAAYNLSHALRDSLIRSWKVDNSVVEIHNGD